MVNIEALSERELDQLHKFYVHLSKLAEKEVDITSTHSIDAANENHKLKLEHFKTKSHYINARKAKNKQSK